MGVGIHIGMVAGIGVGFWFRYRYSMVEVWV